MIFATHPKRQWLKPLLFAVLFVVLFVCVVGAYGVYFYKQQLKPVSSSATVSLVTIESGASLDQIASQLKQAGIIRNTLVFRYYVTSNSLAGALQAGEYELQPRMSMTEIMSVLTHGRVATNLVTILPGKRIGLIRDRLIEEGFPAAEVDAALDPAAHMGDPALIDKPAEASLEGYLYPDSYQRTSGTSAKEVVAEALLQMRTYLTPQLRQDFAKQGLTPYQGLVLASIVEREVSSDTDRAQAAQVFLKRLRIGMRLESDATKYYYNTYQNDGLPPHPISNVTNSSLQAVAHPATTDYLYFVAGNDGVTRFSKTFAEHEATINQTCSTHCGQ